MSYDLEHRANQPAFKSYGEQRIAGVLDQYGIRYQYERPIVVIDRSKERLWYPYVKRTVMWSVTHLPFIFCRCAHPSHPGNFT